MGDGGAVAAGDIGDGKTITVGAYTGVRPASLSVMKDHQLFWVKTFNSGFGVAVTGADAVPMEQHRRRTATRTLLTASKHGPGREP